jgi:SagB-type dehydrogenase family enzyme
MADFGATLFRRSPHLVCYWNGEDFIVQNYATGVRVVGRPVTCDILSFFDDWRPARDLLADRPAWDRSGLRKLLLAFARHSLLQRAGREISLQEKAMDGWRQWNPAAGFFHTATKDVPFDDADTSVRLLRRQSRVTPMPAPVKRYRRSRMFALPPVVTEGEFPRVLLARRTWRRFAAEPLDLRSFSTLIGLTAGIQHWAHASGEGKVALKTSPSGGARHAIELYVLALKVKGLPRGLYHYAADVHGLESISKQQVNAELVERYLPTQAWYRGASAVVLFTAVFPRELWRYPYSRAYRAVLIEAGHLCQTLCLTATWLGLAPFCTMALADSRIENDLKLDGITESVLYAAGVGTRPADAAPPATPASPGLLTRREVRKFPGRIVPGRR